MNTKPNPKLVDEVNPEWTARDFAKAKPASSVLGQIFSPTVATEMLKPRDEAVAAGKFYTGNSAATN